jgi:predicted transport protein
LGLVDEDEEVQEVTDRAYWEERGSKATVLLADRVLQVVHAFAPKLELKYNKHYVGLGRDGQPNNFVIFRPKRKALNMEVRIPQNPEIDAELEQSGLDVMDYDVRWGRYRLRLSDADIQSNNKVLTSLLKRSHDESTK